MSEIFIFIIVQCLFTAYLTTTQDEQSKLNDTDMLDQSQQMNIR